MSKAAPVYSHLILLYRFVSHLLSQAWTFVADQIITELTVERDLCYLMVHVDYFFECIIWGEKFWKGIFSFWCKSAVCDRCIVLYSVDQCGAQISSSLPLAFVGSFSGTHPIWCFFSTRRGSTPSQPPSSSQSKVRYQMCLCTDELL